MAFYDKFPYTNFQEINLDWILQYLKEQEERITEFIAVSAIKYADPIQWSIATQYEANTVVIDGNSGIAYISTQPVPSGVALSNTDYWTVVFDLSTLIADFQNQIDQQNAAITNLRNQVNSELSDMQEEIDDLADQKRKYFFFGDSYGYGYSSDTGTTNRGWFYWVANYLGLDPGDYYYMPAGMEIGGGAYGLASTVAGQHSSFADLFRAYDKSGIPADEITDVVIFSGTNDENYINSIASGISDLNTEIRNFFPKLKRVTLGCLGFSLTSNPRRLLKKVFMEYSKCQKYDWRFSSNSVWSCFNTNYADQDNVHLTQTGYTECSRYLARCAYDGNCEIHHSAEYDCSSVLQSVSTFDNTDTVYPKLFMTFDNGIISANIRGDADSYGTGFSMTISGAYQNASYNLFASPDFLCTSGSAKQTLTRMYTDGTRKYKVLAIAANRYNIQEVHESLTSGLVTDTAYGDSIATSFSAWDI